MRFTVQSGSSENQSQSCEVTDKCKEKPLHRVPPKSSTPQTTSAASLVFYSSANAQMPPSIATQVLPVNLMNTGSFDVIPASLLYPFMYPVAVGSPPVLRSPCLAASAAGAQVSSLSEYQSELIHFS